MKFTAITRYTELSAEDIFPDAPWRLPAFPVQYVYVQVMHPSTK